MAETVKALSTINTVLKIGETQGSLEQVCKIKAYPEIGGGNNNLQTTDQEDQDHTFINGVQGGESSFDFTCNYTPSEYTALEDLSETDDDLWYSLDFSDGEEGSFIWQGRHSVSISAGAVDQVREMVVHCVPSSSIMIQTVDGILTSSDGKEILTNGKRNIGTKSYVYI